MSGLDYEIAKGLFFVKDRQGSFPRETIVPMPCIAIGEEVGKDIDIGFHHVGPLCQS